MKAGVSCPFITAAYPYLTPLITLSRSICPLRVQLSLIKPIMAARPQTFQPLVVPLPAQPLSICIDLLMVMINILSAKKSFLKKKIFSNSILVLYII